MIEMSLRLKMMLAISLVSFADTPLATPLISRDHAAHAFSTFIAYACRAFRPRRDKEPTAPE